MHTNYQCFICHFSLFISLAEEARHRIAQTFEKSSREFRATRTNRQHHRHHYRVPLKQFKVEAQDCRDAHLIPYCVVACRHRHYVVEGYLGDNTYRQVGEKHDEIPCFAGTTHI